jgi:hypothetical protein
MMSPSQLICPISYALVGPQPTKRTKTDETNITSPTEVLDHVHAKIDTMRHLLDKEQVLLASQKLTERPRWKPGSPVPAPMTSSALSRAIAPLATQVIWQANGTWQAVPYGLRLSDELAYIASKNLTNKALANPYPYDFDRNGCIKLAATRIPEDPAPLARAYGLPLITVLPETGVITYTL